jgi:hypothetical protein
MIDLLALMRRHYLDTMRPLIERKPAFGTIVSLNFGARTSIAAP